MNDEIIHALAEYSSDPVGFVDFAFPWGEDGELSEARGPEPWQLDLLKDLGAGVYHR
jgi:hypothetical protein